MIYFLSWLIYPVLEASVQASCFKMWPIWFKKPFNPHKEQGMYLMMARGTAYFTWAIWLQNNVEMYLMEIEGLWFILLTVAFSMCSFWVIFDPLLNFLRYKFGLLKKFDFFYSGSKFQSGILDSLDEIKSQNYYIIAKIIAFSVAILTFSIWMKIFLQ